MGGDFISTEYGNVASHYRKFRLEELCVSNVGIQTGPFGSQLHKKDYVKTGTPIITVEHLYGNCITHENLPMVSDHDKNRLSKYLLKTGDVVFSRVGSVDRNALVRESEDNWLFSGRCLRVRGDQSKIIPRYLSYFFSMEGFKKYIRSIAVGATMPSINTKILSDVYIYVPTLSEQKAIAHILGSLDDKIELNRKMNATLEEMAQALFKSWFVDFDPVIDNAIIAGNKIPEEFAERAEVRRKMLDEGTANREVAGMFPDSFKFIGEMGWIPEGWEPSPLIDLIEIIGGGTPKTSVDKYWRGDIPWFSVVDAPSNSDVYAIDTEKMITELGVKKSSTKILPKGTTIISARGTVGKCALVGLEMAMNQSCYGIRGINGIADIYIYYTIREYVSDLQQRGHGSVFNTITRDTFNGIYVPFSKKELTEVFHSTVTPFFERIRSNLFQNITLIKLRDTLLPKLISGELRIPEAEKIIEDAFA